MKKLATLALVASAFGGWTAGMPLCLSVGDDRPLSKCLLPGCTKLTRHNGGYCSPGHCKEHRALLKMSRGVR